MRNLILAVLSVFLLMACDGETKIEKRKRLMRDGNREEVKAQETIDSVATMPQDGVVVEEYEDYEDYEDLETVSEEPTSFKVESTSFKCNYYIEQENWINISGSKMSFNLDIGDQTLEVLGEGERYSKYINVKQIETDSFNAEEKFVMFSAELINLPLPENRYVKHEIFTFYYVNNEILSVGLGERFYLTEIPTEAIKIPYRHGKPSKMKDSAPVLERKFDKNLRNKEHRAAKIKLANCLDRYKTSSCPNTAKTNFDCCRSSRTFKCSQTKKTIPVY